MILATIAGENFVLQSLKDAELLLQILERATHVATGYIDHPNFRSIAYTTGRNIECGISLTSRDLLTEEEFKAAKAADRTADRAAQKVSESATTAVPA